MTSPGGAVPKTASPGDDVVDNQKCGARSRRGDDYFFFAVFVTDRLRAGAAFLPAFFVRFLVVVFFIAIVSS